VLVCVLMLPLNIYCGLLVHGAQTGAFSTAISMAEIARQAVGPWGYWATATLVYTFIFLVLGDYLLSMGLCLEQLFPDASFSRPVWTLLGATVLLPFCQVRTLNDTRLLLWVNIGALIVSVCVSLGYLISGEPLALAGRAEPPAAVAPSMSWSTGTAGLSKIVFAYVGALMYPEIIVEMVEPADFPKALYAGAPFQLGSFLLVGCVGYGYLGSSAEGLLIEAIPVGTPCSIVAALSLFVHLLITYLIKGTVLTRWIYRQLVPHASAIEEPICRVRLVWLAISTLVLAMCYAVASAVPFFEDLTTLLGALQTPLLGFCLPVLFTVAAYHHTQLPISPFLWVSLIAVFAFGLLFCVIGTAASSVLIAQDWTRTTPGLHPT